MKKNGILKRTNLVVCVFLEMLHEKIEQGYDFFVLDSLLSIFPKINNLPQESLELLLGLPSERKVTFIVLHHCKEDGSMAGPETIKRLFDVAYKLESDTPQPNQESVIHIQVDKPNRDTPEDKGFFVCRTKVSKNVAKHEILPNDSVSVVEQSKKQSIPESIKSFIGTVDGTEIFLDDLFSYLNDKDITKNLESVKNALRKLEHEGLIKNLDGSWKRIGIIR
jgi:hypothetical protein